MLNLPFQVFYSMICDLDLFLDYWHTPCEVVVCSYLISKIFDLTWRSGVQILLFLAGLHNIPDYVYEAAEIEGANDVITTPATEQIPVMTATIISLLIYLPPPAT